jgi:hypothetical protein
LGGKRQKKGEFCKFHLQHVPALPKFSICLYRTFALATFFRTLPLIRISGRCRPHPTMGCELPRRFAAGRTRYGFCVRSRVALIKCQATQNNVVSGPFSIENSLSSYPFYCVDVASECLGLHSAASVTCSSSASKMLASNLPARNVAQAEVSQSGGAKSQTSSGEARGFYASLLVVSHCESLIASGFSPPKRRPALDERPDSVNSGGVSGGSLVHHCCFTPTFRRFDPHAHAAPRDLASPEG